MGRSALAVALGALGLAEAAKLESTAPDFPLPYQFDYPASYEHRGTFPSEFVWGAATAAYQVEGGWDAEDKGLSIWDVFTGTEGSPVNPGMVAAGQTGAIACDSYHRLKDDVALLQRLGLTAYRFSISWPRLLPNGTLAASGGVVSESGLEYYNTLINELLKHGIKPYVTLYHWDLPQALLDDPYTGHSSPGGWKGWLDSRLPAAFAEFADVCFSAFGDRVKDWLTLNEPFTFAVAGHSGNHAPSLCNWEIDIGGCTGGPRPAVGWDVYLAGHNALLAHAHATKLYRSKYAESQGGKIGIALNSYWYEPASHAPADIAAAERAMQFELGWFAEPISTGKYPAVMVKKLGGRLPTFSADEAAMLAGSIDFFAINQYSAMLVRENQTGHDYGAPGGEPVNHGRDCDCATFFPHAWPQSNATWLRSVPWGLRKMLRFIKERYAPPEVFVTENGWADGSRNFREAAHDPQRIRFLANYTAEMLRAVNEDGVPVRGYFAWSLLDNFEWEQGFTQKFGLTYVDFSTPRRDRFVKTSACWYRKLATSNALVPPEPFASGTSEHKAARRPTLEQILAGRHALPAWMRSWESGDNDEIDLCETGLVIKTPFSMDFLSDFQFLVGAFFALCALGCLYVNKELLNDISLLALASVSRRREGSPQAEPMPMD